MDKEKLEKLFLELFDFFEKEHALSHDEYGEVVNCKGCTLIKSIKKELVLK